MMTSPPATDHNQNHGHGHTARVNDYFPSSSSSSSSFSAASSTSAAAVTANTFGILYDTVTVSALSGKNANNHNQSNINTSNINHHNKRLRTGSISGRLRYVFCCKTKFKANLFLVRFKENLKWYQLYHNNINFFN